VSHIAFELDALPLVPKVARSAGIQEAVVGWGLTQMWEWCWREKTDKVTTNHLRGFFGSELGAILVDFGFLEAIGSSVWRVRGAQRYLRIQEGRERGGKAAAAAGNLKRGRAAPAGPNAGASLQLPSSTSPAPLQLDSRLSATSDERLATSDKRNTGPAPKPRAVNPRLGPLIGRLKKSYHDLVGKPLDPTDQDVAALKTLLGRGDDDEIDRRWRKGLSASQFETKCATFLKLLQVWPELAIERAASTGPPRGAATAADTDWSNYREGDTARELFGEKP
jgi:hypothetical protein